MVRRRKQTTEYTEYTEKFQPCRRFNSWQAFPVTRIDTANPSNILRHAPMAGESTIWRFL
jgi:hypothetical protein